MNDTRNPKERNVLQHSCPSQFSRNRLHHTPSGPRVRWPYRNMSMSMVHGTDRSLFMVLEMRKAQSLRMKKPRLCDLVAMPINPAISSRYEECND